MSLLTDLSGVNAAQTDIDTVGNNIANVNTTAFKVSDAQFSALYGSALSATPGQGVNTADLAQSFKEGSVSQTGNPLDVAITGNGFFQLQSGSGIVYSRDGSFQISSSGQLVNASGAQVMGFAPTANGAAASSAGSLQPIQINQANIAPAATSDLTLGVNLPTSDAPINTATIPFSPSNPQSYNESTTTTVYDSLGTSLSLTTYFTQVAGSGSPNQWQTNWVLTTPSGTSIASGAGPTLSFNSSGQLVSGSGSITRERPAGWRSAAQHRRELHRDQRFRSVVWRQFCCRQRQRRRPAYRRANRLRRRCNRPILEWRHPGFRNDRFGEFCQPARAGSDVR